MISWIEINGVNVCKERITTCPFCNIDLIDSSILLDTELNIDYKGVCPDCKRNFIEETLFNSFNLLNSEKKLSEHNGEWLAHLIQTDLQLHNYPKLGEITSKLKTVRTKVVAKLICAILYKRNDVMKLALIRDDNKSSSKICSNVTCYNQHDSAIENILKMVIDESSNILTCIKLKNDEFDTLIYNTTRSISAMESLISSVQSSNSKVLSKLEQIKSSLPINIKVSFTMGYLVKKNNINTIYIISNLSTLPIFSFQGIHIVKENSYISKTLYSCYLSNTKQFNIRDDQYQIIDAIILDKKTVDQYAHTPQSDISNYDTKQLDIYVYSRLKNKCTNRHHVDTVTLNTINIKNNSPLSFNIFYCNDCKEYFVTYEMIQNIIKQGKFPKVSFRITNNNSSHLKEYSTLMLYGYNTRENALSAKDRRDILAWIIDSNLMTKAEIIKDLQFKVNYNGKKENNKSAKEKWLSDIDFVTHYTKGNKFRVKAKNVRYINK